MKIRHISSEDTNKLADFFNGISTDETIKNFFHPHPFTKEYAEKICSKKGIKEDLYFVAKGNNEIIGYAMLRGWDEGYDIPSFGICVHPRHQRKGIGKKLTHHAIDLCKKKKVKKVMLKVYKENIVACKIYKKFGFDFIDETEDKKQWIGYLELK